MLKKIFLLSALSFVIASGVSAQRSAHNSLALSAGIIGVDLSYELMFNTHFSVLADVSYTTLVIIDDFTLGIKPRVYPFGKAFYLELGLGFAYGRSISDMMGHIILGMLTFGWYFTTLDDEDLARKGGFLIGPGLGWKIDIGKPDGFVLPISIGLDFKTGKIPSAMPYARIGLGYSF